MFDYGLYDAPLREGLPPEHVKGILDAHAGAGYATIQIARRFPVTSVPATPSGCAHNRHSGAWD